MPAHLSSGLTKFTTTMLATIVLYAAGSFLYWKFFREEPAGRVPGP